MRIQFFKNIQQRKLLFWKIRVSFFSGLMLVALAFTTKIATSSEINIVKRDGKLGKYLAGRHAQFIDDSGSAINYFEDLLSSKKNNVGIQDTLFYLLVKSGKIQKASPLAHKIAKTDSKSAPLAKLFVSLVYIKEGKYQEALDTIKKIENSGINYFSRTIIISWLHTANINFKTGIALLKKEMKNPAYVAIFAPHAALISEYAGKPELSRKYFDDALLQYRQVGANLTRLIGEFYERNDEQSKALNIYRNFNKLSENETLFRYALERTQQNRPERIKLSVNRGVAEGLYHLSSSIRRQNQYQSILLSRLAIFMYPEFSFAKLRLADQLTEENLLDEALAIYKKLSQDKVYAWLARLRVARIYDYQNKLDEAEKILLAMAKERPKELDPLINLGNMYRGRDKHRQAVRYYEKAKKRIRHWMPMHWRLLYSSGASLERLKRWPDAEKDFLKALELKPDQPSVLNYLGYSWIEQGKHLLKSKAMIEKAVKQRPRSGHIIDSLGWVQYRLGDYDQAVKNLERAVLISPADPTINEHLGDVYWQVGRKLEAGYQWERALSLEPEKNQMKSIKKKIKTGL